MSSQRNVLMIGTYGIDIFHGVAQAFEDLNCMVFKATSYNTAKHYCKNHAFDTILVNLEPDGHGQVHGIEQLQLIVDSPLQHHSVCFGVSTQTADKLLFASEYQAPLFSLLVCCLTLPLMPKQTCEKILQLMNSSEHLKIENRLEKLNAVRNSAVA